MESPLILVWLLIVAALVGLLAFVNLQHRRLQARLREVEQAKAAAYHRLEAILSLSQAFVETGDEQEIIGLVLSLARQLTGAMGASFVPLDEHGQPRTSVRSGEFPFPLPDAWLEYLASPEVRQGCARCERRETVVTACPLLKGPFSGVLGIYCLSVRRGEREFGVLNLYLPGVERLDADTQAFLRSMADETALALESVRLRRREIDTLRQLQAFRQKTDLTTSLSATLSSLRQTLPADFAFAWLALGEPQREVSDGEIDVPEREFMQRAGPMVMAAGDPAQWADPVPQAAPALRAVSAVPLIGEDQPPVGVLFVGNRRSDAFHPRQMALLQTVAEQIAVLVNNSRRMAELEYRLVMDERIRLAREIHDGLAQTLGFLKLQVAQMQTHFDRGDAERLRHMLKIAYEALAEAYLDVRQTLDNLRIRPAKDGAPSDWLQQTVSEFRENSGLVVEYQSAEAPKRLAVTLAPEIQMQLIRIVQEALGNIRKHAHARQAWVSLGSSNGDLVIEVRDDGRGFLPEEVPGLSRHGLRGMRERAELIGADFQVISRPDQGTIVRVQLCQDAYEVKV